MFFTVIVPLNVCVTRENKKPVEVTCTWLETIEIVLATARKFEATANKAVAVSKEACASSVPFVQYPAGSCRPIRLEIPSNATLAAAARAPLAFAFRFCVSSVRLTISPNVRPIRSAGPFSTTRSGVSAASNARTQSPVRTAASVLRTSARSPRSTVSVYGFDASPVARNPAASNANTFDAVTDPLALQARPQSPCQSPVVRFIVRCRYQRPSSIAIAADTCSVRSPILTRYRDDDASPDRRSTTVNFAVYAVPALPEYVWRAETSYPLATVNTNGSDPSPNSHVAWISAPATLDVPFSVVGRSASTSCAALASAPNAGTVFTSGGAPNAGSENTNSGSK